MIEEDTFEGKEEIWLDCGEWLSVDSSKKQKRARSSKWENLLLEKVTSVNSANCNGGGRGDLCSAKPVEGSACSPELIKLVCANESPKCEEFEGGCKGYTPWGYWYPITSDEEFIAGRCQCR